MNGGEIASKLTDTKWRFSLARAKTKSCYLKLMLRADIARIKATAGAHQSSFRKVQHCHQAETQSLINTLGIDHKFNETRMWRRLMITCVVLTHF